MTWLRTAAVAGYPPLMAADQRGRVLHGPGVRGLVPRIVQSGAQSWPRRPLPAVGSAVPHASPRSDGGVALWLAQLDDFDAGALAAHLDSADAARAVGIVDGAARRRFIVSRGLLRQLLAARSGVAPNELTLCAGEHGKPTISHCTAAGCHFNLSHTGGWWLLALTDSPVGVDLEMADRVVDAARLAVRVFTPGEEAALQLAGTDPAAARAVFLDCWTRKEALLKALGTGFAGGAKAFHVGPGPDDTIVPTPGHAQAALRVRSLALPFAAHAAIACAPAIMHYERSWLQGAAA
jgi:phosphopantetheinyl transferase